MNAFELRQRLELLAGEHAEHTALVYIALMTGDEGPAVFIDRRAIMKKRGVGQKQFNRLVSRICDGMQLSVFSVEKIYSLPTKPAIANN